MLGKIGPLPRPIKNSPNVVKMDPFCIRSKTIAKKMTACPEKMICQSEYFTVSSPERNRPASYQQSKMWSWRQLHPQTFPCFQTKKCSPKSGRWIPGSWSRWKRRRKPRSFYVSSFVINAISVFLPLAPAFVQPFSKLEDSFLLKLWWKVGLRKPFYNHRANSYPLIARATWYKGLR